MPASEIYYGDYLQLDKLLNAQNPESDKQGQPAHDEMLFIIIHQSYELWFKQVMHELRSVIAIFKNPVIKDNSPDMRVAVHRLKRIVTILEIAVKQIDVLETMTPLDFLDFRNLLRPASGFQSVQFKALEAMLGLKMEERHGKEHYLSQLRKEDIEKIKHAEKEMSLLQLVNEWLERMPFFEKEDYWKNLSASKASERHPFWEKYRELYSKSLIVAEKENLESFDKIFFGTTSESRLSAKANRSILFIMLYRDYPVLQHPFELLNTLIDIDTTLATWRYRHMNMVQRMIGSRVGTGGSSGKDYLKDALDKHYIFKEISALNTFLIERRNLPKLDAALEEKLGFGKL